MSNDLENQISDALARQERARRDNLRGFEHDAYDAFLSTDLFEEVETRQTDDPRQSVVVTCRLNDHATPTRDIIQTIEQAWKQLAYRDGNNAHESNAVTTIEMKFVTESDSGLLVTGKVVVEKIGG